MATSMVRVVTTTKVFPTRPRLRPGRAAYGAGPNKEPAGQVQPLAQYQSSSDTPTPRYVALWL
jgi:hypothetical protein